MNSGKTKAEPKGSAFYVRCFMGNIIDFVKTQGAKSFEELPFTPVDAAVLCQLSYLKFEYLPENMTLLESAAAGERGKLFEDDRFGDLQRDLYFEALFSRRYQNMRVSFVVSEKLEEPELCFCGMVFFPQGCTPAVVFRGTDEYIVGWKEDFEMAFISPVPSQIMSVYYLTFAAEKIEDRFFVCGHSKGGNLAIGAAVNSPAEVRDRIKFIYNLDGPGFRSDISERDGYAELRGRTMKLVPEKTFVGRLLQDTTVCSVVESKGLGLMQHAIFNWKVDKFGDFIFKEESLLSVRNRLSGNIASLSDDQLKCFVEALFSILKDADVENIVEFRKQWLKNSRKLLEAYSELDCKTRRLLRETVSELLKSVVQEGAVGT